MTYATPDFHFILVFACDETGLIGRNGGLPWDLPEDLAYFKALTSRPDSAVLMGYKTWESLPIGKTSGEKLAGRKKLVVTRKEGLKPLKDTVFTKNYTQMTVKAFFQPLGINTVFIIGGKEIIESTIYDRTGFSMSFVKETLKRQPGDVVLEKHIVQPYLIQSNFVTELSPKVALYQSGISTAQSPSQVTNEIRGRTVLRTFDTRYRNT